MLDQEGYRPNVGIVLIQPNQLKNMAGEMNTSAVTPVSEAKLSIAKVYLSIFPIIREVELLAGIQSNAPLIKHEVSQRTKHQLRRMPQLKYNIDDSLEYIDQIDKSLKRTENPIDNPDLLENRKKV